MRVVAIDQGTTSTRALVFEDDAPPRVVASLRHRQIYPQPGWVEHDPRELLANVIQCLAAAGPVNAIGIANQGESCLAWDAVTLRPLSPVIVWQDRRTFDLIEQLKAAGLGPDVATRAGVPLDCYFSASKLAWILEHSLDARASRQSGALRLGTTDTFLLECLTRTHATDATTASRTSLMNLATLAWDSSLCEAFDVPIEALAPILPTTGPFGEYHGVPIRASVVDQQAALFGHGCRIVGDAKMTFGTGAFALALTGPTPPTANTAGMTSTVAWRTDTEIQYALEGGVYDAGAAIEWAMRIGMLESPVELHTFDAPAAIARGLVFVPALSGLGCPQWSRTAGGLWSGMNAATTRRDLQQSLLEGIALQAQRVIAAIDQVISLGDVLSVDGGLSSSEYFLQFLADVTKKTINQSSSTELTAYGCALLAGHVPHATSSLTPKRRYQPMISAKDRTARIDRYRGASQAAVDLGSSGI
jgi:glycerol kinase